MICAATAAQNLQGVINGRSGATMTLRAQYDGDVVMVLTPSAEVDEVQRLLKYRKN